MYRSKIIAVGGYLPDSVMHNDDFSKYLDTSDDWIRSRTGIRSRRIIGVNQSTSDMAKIALERALESISMKHNDLDGVIVATTTPDQIMPSTAVLVAKKIGLRRAFAFDIQAVCAGFIYAMHIANSLIESGGAENIAIIGADAMSKVVDWNDRSTCVLFGDGAGAMILSRTKEVVTLHKASGDKAALTRSSGFLDSVIYSDPELSDILQIEAGVGTFHHDGKIQMDGKEVFRYAVSEMPRIIRELAAGVRLESKDLDIIIPHQANSRIIQAIEKELCLSAIDNNSSLDKEIEDIDKATSNILDETNNIYTSSTKIIDTVAYHANTSAATIPLAMWEAIANGDIAIGSKKLIAFTAVGAGMTSGGALFSL